MEKLNLANLDAECRMQDALWGVEALPGTSAKERQENCDVRLDSAHSIYTAQNTRSVTNCLKHVLSVNECFNRQIPDSIVARCQMYPATSC